MSEYRDNVAELASAIVALDSRSFVSNLKVADRLAAELKGFEIELLDYVDDAGVAKRAIVAARGRGGIAFSGHMDTVPDTGWQTDPWSGKIDPDGLLRGLGAADMKGPLAASVVAARALPPDVPVALLITTDEETTKQGARVIAQRSTLARAANLRGILVVEPTRMRAIRGHRSHITFTAVAIGTQAHSSTGQGDNANWRLIPFLAEMKTLFLRLRDDPAFHDADYTPPFSDFNLVIDNHGTAINVTVPKATARIKFRYSAKFDPTPILEEVRRAAASAGVQLTEGREGTPPELPAGHPLVRLCAEVSGAAPVTAPFGTDASELQAIAPCVVMGPGDIAVAHRPEEWINVSELADAIPAFMHIARRVAKG